MSYPLGLLAVHRAFREGTLSPADYIASCTQRADEVEPWLKAFCDRLPGEQLTGGEGPLAGIPIGIKDIIATAGIRTTNGSRVYADHVPDQDAPIVARIKQLGGIVFGKTVSTEFAWRCPHVLKAAGNDLSRDNIMKQALSIKELELPMLLPGIKVQTAADDHLPIEQVQFMRFTGKQWERFGEVRSTK